jgi:hypothetical protein
VARLFGDRSPQHEVKRPQLKKPTLQGLDPHVDLPSSSLSFLVSTRPGFAFPTRMN